MGDSIYSDDGDCYQIGTFKKRQRGCYSMQNMATLALNGAKRYGLISCGSCSSLQSHHW